MESRKNGTDELICKEEKERREKENKLTDTNKRTNLQIPTEEGVDEMGLTYIRCYV